METQSQRAPLQHEVSESTSHFQVYFGVENERSVFGSQSNFRCSPQLLLRLVSNSPSRQALTREPPGARTGADSAVLAAATMPASNTRFHACETVQPRQHAQLQPPSTHAPGGASRKLGQARTRGSVGGDGGLLHAALLLQARRRRGSGVRCRRGTIRETAALAPPILHHQQHDHSAIHPAPTTQHSRICNAARAGLLSRGQMQSRKLRPSWRRGPS